MKFIKRIVNKLCEYPDVDHLPELFDEENLDVRKILDQLFSNELILENSLLEYLKDLAVREKYEDCYVWIDKPLTEK